MSPLRGLPGGHRDVSRSGLRSVAAGNGSIGTCVGCYQAHDPVPRLGAESQLLLGEQNVRADPEEAKMLS